MIWYLPYAPVRGVPGRVAATGLDASDGGHEPGKARGVGGERGRRGEDPYEDDRREGSDEDRLQTAMQHTQYSSFLPDRHGERAERCGGVAVGVSVWEQDGAS